MFSLRPHWQGTGGLGVRGAFWGRLGGVLPPGEGTPHLLAGTAVAGTWHGTCQPLPQRLPSPAGAERSELLPLLLREARAVPLLHGEAEVRDTEETKPREGSTE